MAVAVEGPEYTPVCILWFGLSLEAPDEHMLQPLISALPPFKNRGIIHMQ